MNKFKFFKNLLIWSKHHLIFLLLIIFSIFYFSISIWFISDSIKEKNHLMMISAILTIPTFLFTFTLTFYFYSKQNKIKEKENKKVENKTISKSEKESEIILNNSINESNKESKEIINS